MIKLIMSVKVCLDRTTLINNSIKYRVWWFCMKQLFARKLNSFWKSVKNL